MSDFWVFGYGSLIWKPEFKFKAEQRACLQGYHRNLCIDSWHYRGTQEKPGLVFGLDAGGSCEGMARLVDGEHKEEVLAYLRERELLNNVYKEVIVSIDLIDGTTVEAVTYVADETHEQYNCSLGQDEIVRRIKRASGIGGPNLDYVKNTYAALQSMNIKDEKLETLVQKLD